MSDDYKTSKEAFVSGMTGSSIAHINMISLVALFSVTLYSALRTRLPASASISFPLELLILVLPLLLSITLFANSPLWLSAILMIPTGLLLLLPRRESGTPLPSNLSPSRSQSPAREKEHTVNSNRTHAHVQSVTISPLPALTTYRSHMLLLTFLSILAVDFPVFPRSLAKCETFGVSMMDLGVGSFIFSQGIVSAIPLIKNPWHLKDPLLPKVALVFRKCLPLFALGIIRTLSVKGVEYPEHQTEYGTHWNFFITLALIPPLEVLLHPLMVRLPISFLGVVVALVHQTALSCGLTTFVLNAPRTSLISANKEGLISLPGYLAVHLLGLSTGTLVLPPSPSYFRRRQQQLAPTPRTHADSDSDSDSDTVADANTTSRTPRAGTKTAIELFSYAAVWWVLLAAARALSAGGGVSRRLVNVQYVLWVAAFNTSFLLGYLLLDLRFAPGPGPVRRGAYKPPVAPTRAPALLEAVNRNGLVLFLLVCAAFTCARAYILMRTQANVATGLVNLAIPTMHVPDWAAMLVLALYAAGICAVAWAFCQMRLWRF
ncbi:GWT1-domain-containing protein [Amylocystis lapponica]|nr:GWT1-domain-containing protein [Amylocystis lapponica]